MLTLEQLRIRLNYLGYTEGLDWELPDWWSNDLNRSYTAILELAGHISNNLGIPLKQLID